MKILIIEDEKDLAESIESYLTEEGYICETVLNFNQAYEKINLYKYDCIVVDITLPDGNGLDIIREVMKKHVDSGIIIVSAKSSLDDKISGLEIGADDYLTKPFHLSELNARIKSVIRRRQFNGEKEIRIDNIKIFPDAAQVFVNDQPLELTKKEFELLMFLIANKNRVLTKGAIAEHLWGDQIDMADSFDFIYTHVKNLRKKILEKGGKDNIRTIYGLGYTFKSRLLNSHQDWAGNTHYEISACLSVLSVDSVILPINGYNFLRYNFNTHTPLTQKRGESVKFM